MVRNMKTSVRSGSSTPVSQKNSTTNEYPRSFLRGTSTEIERVSSLHLTTSVNFSMVRNVRSVDNRNRPTLRHSCPPENPRPWAPIPLTRLTVSSGTVHDTTPSSTSWTLNRRTDLRTRPGYPPSSPRTDSKPRRTVLHLRGCRGPPLHNKSPLDLPSESGRDSLLITLHRVFGVRTYIRTRPLSYSTIPTPPKS